MTIKEMVARKSELIELKKAAFKLSDPVKIDLSKNIISKSSITGKSFTDDTEDSIMRKIIGNTYYYLDEHDDIHVKGCFAKSIKERADKIFHLHDHEFKITAKVGNPQNIYEEEFAWKDLGVDREGITTALSMETEIRKEMNKLIFNQYKSGQIDQHSVGMRYIKLELAVNDDTEKEEYAVWQKYIGEIANREKAESQGFFWVVKEAALFEISAVLMGSNPITPTLEPEKSTQITDEEAAEALLESKKLFYKHLI